MNAETELAAIKEALHKANADPYPGIGLAEWIGFMAKLLDETRLGAEEKDARIAALETEIAELKAEQNRGIGTGWVTYTNDSTKAEGDG